MFNPNARALYTERGISPVFNTYYRMYQQAESAGDKTAANQALELAQTQVQQMANIKKASGREDPW
jgi:ribosomal protein S20